jgi:uncharacterized lipoprotein YddW (UPF0748 family)
MKRITSILILLLLISTAFAATAGSPKHEFRGVWLSTVANIDWPVKRTDSEAKKQADLIRYLDKMQETGINAVLFQVRPSCDAMYNSPFEPWSYWFSGSQGDGPPADSLWDPLAFAVEEAHKRGMELHAWVNPYRVVVHPAMIDSAGYISDQHISRKRPDWLLKFNSVYILDPGKAEVRDYITKIFMDIVNRYDIDGLHMDDYFYPYSPIQNEDTLTFVEENRGFTDVHDWRRDNINQLVEMVADSINKVKPWVKWGISPFGIYKPGTPAGIEGFNAWAVLYCDPLAWLEAGTVDYITPQLYWPFGGGQDYGTLMPWWAKLSDKHKRHFYPGQAMYRAASDRFPEGEIPRQIRLNRETRGCQGSVFFTANNFFSNPKGSIDSMRLDLYSQKALWPVFEHKKGRSLQTPAVYSEKNDGFVHVFWNQVPGAWGYVIYRSPVKSELTKDAASILEIVKDPVTMHKDHTDEEWFYAVTALNEYKAESSAGLAAYDFVVPLRPEYNSTAGKLFRVLFRWKDYPGAEDYHIQVSTDRDFDLIVYQERFLTGTRLRKDLQSGHTYYWRIKASNNDVWSPVWTFNR